MGMGGKGGGGAGAHDYYGTIAGLVCAGPVDSILGIVADGKTVWPEADGDWVAGTYYDAGTTIRSGGRAWVCSSNHTADDINRPGETSAPWVEYALNRSDPGVTNPVTIAVPGYGTALLFWGTDWQTLPDGLPPEIADNHPPYRRQCWVLFQDWLFGRERTSAPNLQVLVRRAPAQTVVTGPASGLDSDGQANPIAFAAEAISDPVFGADNAGLISAPAWQEAADLLHERPDLWYVSPFIAEATTFDAFADAVGSYVRAFKRSDGAGRVELGILPTSEAPPVWNSDMILDESCLADPLRIETDTGVLTEVSVKYSDRVRAFKPRTAKSTDTLSRGTLAGEVVNLDRPWITRASQAAFAASDALRRGAEPEFTGTAVCIGERVLGIREGELFLLRDRTTGIEVPCRCETITLSAPPACRRTITFRSETGFTPLLSLDGSGETVGGAPPEAETVTAFQLVQPPPSLVGGEKFALLALVARTSRVTTSVRVWMQESDPSLFAELGIQTAFAVAGNVVSWYPTTLPPSGHTQDDNSESLRIQFDPDTPAADIANLGETQTADAINDARLLVWLFSADDPTQFEICTVKAIRIAAGEDFYRLKVRRARFGTSRIEFEVGDRAYIIRRANLVPYAHQRFGAYAVTGQAAVFRLQAGNPWRTADLSDPAACPDRSFTFADPYAPRIQWTRIEQRDTSGDSWADVTDFDVDFPETSQFRLSATIRDSNKDLVSAFLKALGPEASETTISSDIASGGQDTIQSTFSIAEGDWTMVLRAIDRTGRSTEAALTEVGGFTPVTLRVRPPGSTVVANPMPSPRGGLFFDDVPVVLPCSTASATVEYQVVPLGDAVGGSWTTGGSVTVPVDSTLYTRATKAGWTDSPITRDDYRYQDPEAVG